MTDTHTATITSGHLTNGQRVEGTSTGPGYTSTWSGTFDRIALDTHDGREDYAYFTDGQINGVPQEHFGFPVARLTDTPQPSQTLAIADEDDLVASVDSRDLVAALGFLVDTVYGMGPDDVASYLAQTAGWSDATPDDAVALADRLTAVSRAVATAGA